MTAHDTDQRTCYQWLMELKFIQYPFHASQKSNKND